MLSENRGQQTGYSARVLPRCRAPCCHRPGARCVQGASVGLGSRHLEEAGEGPPGTGWPVWRRWVGRQAACPVTVFLPSQPPHLAILPWEPGGHLQESHARDSLSEAPATCSSAAVGAVWVARPRRLSLAAADECAHTAPGRPRPLWAVHRLAQALASASAPALRWSSPGAGPVPGCGTRWQGCGGRACAQGPWPGVEARGESRPRVLLGTARCWSWGDRAVRGLQGGRGLGS